MVGCHYFPRLSLLPVDRYSFYAESTWWLLDTTLSGRWEDRTWCVGTIDRRVNRLSYRATNWAVPDPKPIYFLDPTSIPDLHARFQITNLIYLLPVTRFMMRDRGQFCEQNMLYFLGCFNKNGYKIVNNWLRPLYHTLFKSYYITPCSETIVRLLSQLWLIF